MGFARAAVAGDQAAGKSLLPAALDSVQLFRTDTWIALGIAEIRIWP